MMRTSRLLGAAVIAMCSAPAYAELNLWISYHFQGIESFDAGKYHDAEKLLTKAELETCDAHRDAFTFDALGRTYTALQNYPAAEEALQKALCLREEELGEASRFVPATLNNLADLHYVAGNKEKVETLYRRALKITEKDPYSMEKSRALNGLALLAADAGNFAEAENLLKRAAKVHFLGGRSEHPFMATALTNLGILYTELGRYEEAADSLAHAKRIHQATIGENHPDVAVRLHAVAKLKAKMGEAAKAGKYQDKANAIQEHFNTLNG